MISLSSLCPVFKPPFPVFIPHPSSLHPPSVQLGFLEGAAGCGLREAREAIRWRKAAVVRATVFSKQSTLHVIVFGVYAL